MEDLRGHNFNIYECAFLDPKTTNVCTAVFSVVVQVLLFASLTYYNMEISKSKFTHDILVLIISMTTTIFFGKQAYGQMKNAHSFNSIFRIVGNQGFNHRVWRMVNMLINVVMGAIGGCQRGDSEQSGTLFHIGAGRYSGAGLG